MPKITHGSLRRHDGSEERWSGGGRSSATEPAARPRRAPTNTSATISRTYGIALVDTRELAQEVGQDVGLVAGDEVLEHAQGETDRERQRDRAHPCDCHRAQRGEHHDDEGRVVEVEQRRDEYAGEGCERDRQHPCDPRGPVRGRCRAGWPGVHGRPAPASADPPACDGSRRTGPRAATAANTNTATWSVLRCTS